VSDAKYITDKQARAPRAGMRADTNEGRRLRDGKVLSATSAPMVADILDVAACDDPDATMLDDHARRGAHDDETE
jgi:hypothetical protein